MRVVHRRRGAAEAALALLDVERVALRGHRVQVLEQLVAVDEGERRARLEARARDHLAVEALLELAGPAGEQHLAERGAVGGSVRPTRSPVCTRLGALLAVEVHDLEVAELAEVGRLAGAAREVGEHRARERAAGSARPPYERPSSRQRTPRR